jgi:integrase
VAREIYRLNARGTASLSAPGRHSDGGGLYLSISADGRRRWVFLYRWQGKRVELGLGSARVVSLAKAREKAKVAREQVADGANPKTARKPSGGPTFAQMAERVMEAMRPSWRNGKHAAQWQMTLREYAAPLANLQVDKITTDDVLSVLNPLWNEKPETASRLRGRIERVLDAAKARGLRSGENSARWRGHLENLLPKRQRLTRGHHRAMPYADVPEFMERLRHSDGISARALEYLVLTASRSGEVLGAKWDEVDLSLRTWTVPPLRMKGGREHRVPLSDAAHSLLRDMQEIRITDYVFPGDKAGSPLSDMALSMTLRRMNVENATVHGFRSAFRDWAAERTNVAREVCEAALAHSLQNKVEAAYKRTDLFEKRRMLMQMWAHFNTSARSEAEVVPIRRKDRARARAAG